MSPEKFPDFRETGMFITAIREFCLRMGNISISKTIQIILLKTDMLHKQNMKKKLRPSLNETKPHIPPVLYDFHV